MADSSSIAVMAEDKTGSEMARFFDTTPIPDNIKEVEKTVNSFVSFHRSKRNKIVLITSGGTTVPLEKQTVRFLDNFSTGSRGALSAEQFIAQGYAVIFLHRSSSLLPFHRNLMTTPILDLLEVSTSGEVVMATSENIKPILTQYKQVIITLRNFKRYFTTVKVSNLLCSISFSSLFDFLHYMRVIVPLLNDLSSIVYCAAAVSDFYIHPNDMEEHKISSSSSLTLNLQGTPKLLSTICRQWSPKALVISFKLETNEAILIESARKALKKYGHQLVVANCLETRKTSLHIIEADKRETVSVTLSVEEQKRGMNIEEKLIPILIDIHCKRTA